MVDPVFCWMEMLYGYILFIIEPTLLDDNFDSNGLLDLSSEAGMCYFTIE